MAAYLFLKPLSKWFSGSLYVFSRDGAVWGFSDTEQQSWVNYSIQLFEHLLNINTIWVLKID